MTGGWKVETVRVSITRNAAGRIAEETLDERRVLLDGVDYDTAMALADRAVATLPSGTRVTMTTSRVVP